MAYASDLENELENEFEAELEDESEYEMEDEMEDESEGEGWLGAIGNIASSLLGESEDEYESEYEFEDEYEDEFEGEATSSRKIYSDAMMEHLGQLAAEAESEDEAVEHFLPLVGMAASKLLPVVAKAVAPMAKKVLPKIAHAVTKATPQLTKGIARVTRTLHRNPQTRHLLKTVPTIARRTVGNIAHKAARGAHVTPHAAVRTLAKQAHRVLGTPNHRVKALRLHNHLERKFHGHIGKGIAHPLHRHGQHLRMPIGALRHVRAVYGAPALTRVRAGAAPHLAHRVVTGTAKPGVRYGRLASGQCTCAACPACGTAAYCRCCGQVIR